MQPSYLFFVLLATTAASLHHSKQKRQIFREQVLPQSGGKIPEGAFSSDRLALNRLNKEGIAVPDGVLLEARHRESHFRSHRHDPDITSSIVRLVQRPDGRYAPPEGRYPFNNLVESTYVIRTPVTGKFGILPPQRVHAVPLTLPARPFFANDDDVFAFNHIDSPFDVLTTFGPDLGNTRVWTGFGRLYHDLSNRILRETTAAPGTTSVPTIQGQDHNQQNNFAEPARQVNGFAEPARQANGFAEPTRQSNAFVEPTRQSNGFAEPTRENNAYAEPTRQTNGFVEPTRQNNGFAEPTRQIGGFADPTRQGGGFAEPTRPINGFVKPTRQGGFIDNKRGALPEPTRQISNYGDAKVPAPNLPEPPLETPGFNNAGLNRQELGYPSLTTIPKTGFTCSQTSQNMIPDPETGCQVFHLCHSDGQKESFLCPVGSRFDGSRNQCGPWTQIQCNSGHKGNPVQNARPLS